MRQSLILVLSAALGLLFSTCRTTPDATSRSARGPDAQSITNEWTMWVDYDLEPRDIGAYDALSATEKKTLCDTILVRVEGLFAGPPPGQIVISRGDERPPSRGEIAAAFDGRLGTLTAFAAEADHEEVTVLLRSSQNLTQAGDATAMDLVVTVHRNHLPDDGTTGPMPVPSVPPTTWMYGELVLDLDMSALQDLENTTALAGSSMLVWDLWRYGIVLYPGDRIVSVQPDRPKEECASPGDNCVEKATGISVAPWLVERVSRREARVRHRYTYRVKDPSLREKLEALLKRLERTLGREQTLMPGVEPALRVSGI